MSEPNDPTPEPTPASPDSENIQRSQKLTAWEERLRQWEARLGEVESAAIAREQAVQAHAEEVARRETNLANQKRVLLQREAEATAGFARQNEAAVLSLESQLVRQHQALKDLEMQLIDRRETSERQIAVEVTRKLQDMGKEIASMRDETLQPVEQMRQALNAERVQFEKDRATEVEEIQDLRRRSIAEMEKRKGDQEKKQEAALADAFATAKAELAEQRRALELREIQIGVRADGFEQELHAMKSHEEQSVKQEKRRAAVELSAAREDAEILRHDRDKLETQVTALRAQIHGFGARSPEEIFGQIQRQEKVIADLEAELKKRPSAERAQQLSNFETQFEQAREAQRRAEHVNQELLKEREDLKADLARMRTGNVNLECLRDEKETINAHCQQLKLLVAQKQKLIDQLTGRPDLKNKIDRGTEAWKLRMGDLWDPVVEVDPRKHRETAGEIREMDWLKDVAQKIAGIGFHFSERLLFAFHTCLKISDWAPLTVLAGISGTGKSELPRLYSRFGGLHFLPVSVQPNWDSPQDVFGYFNSMDDRYHARPLLRAMFQFQENAMFQSQEKRDAGFPNHMLLVLLDEMNLARVELYLSELLSKWELGRGEKNMKLEIDLGPDCEKEAVFLRPNALFVGTINEDETTQALSDKVLDRGNLLYFPAPPTFRERDSLNLGTPRATMLPFKTWDGWKKKPVDLRSHPEAECEKYRTVLQNINRKLAAVDRAMGHRVWQSVEVYIANHPNVCAALDANDATALEAAVARAFEDQLVQKVVPKLRGIETEHGARKQCLDPIKGLIAQNAPGLEKDFDAALNSGRRTFFWQQSSYLDPETEESHAP